MITFYSIKMIYRYIAVIILVVIDYACCIKHYNLCVSDSQSRLRDCVRLSSPNAEVHCIAALDSHDCAFKLKNQNAHLAIFTAEQIAFVAPIIKHYTQIIFKVQEPGGLPTYKLRMGVVVEKNITLSTLKGARYCHPGFGNSARNDHIMKIFESEVVPRGNCLSKNSSIENELDSLTKFFGDNSCRPGKWTEDASLEENLRKQFSVLCANCHNPETCSNDPSKDNHDEGALRCVTQRGGQVAYVSIDAVKEYFRVYGEYAANYSYLCRDGTKMDIGVDQPCAWYEEPLDAIVAISELATELQNKIKDWMQGSEEWHESLKSVLNVDHSRTLINFNGRPLDYAKNVNENTDVTSCERTIKWCTTSSLENEKCETLKHAATLHAIKPELICVQADSVWECLNKTKENENDILGIDTSLAYVAYKYYNLQPVQYQECAEENRYKTVAIVKTNIANSFDDLEKKTVCFPEFGGLAHITIFEKLKTKRNKEACLDGDLLGQFFAETCIPSILPELHDASNYCSLCTSTNCSLPTKRSYFPDAKAVECLVTNPEYAAAFINANSIKSILDDPGYRSRFREDQYRVLCRDGRKMPLNKTVNKDCAFETRHNGLDLIVGSKSLSSVQLTDIDLAFRKMDSLFGPSSKLWLFNMYGTYKGTDDLLFKVTTTALTRVDSHEGVVEPPTNCYKSSGFAVMSSKSTIFSSVSLLVFVTL
ncbi:transferrin isoform X2 [Anabrus simplex]|uniref:transferrin isoform X2 n=1 Tax=Anabrus simplex TaxID=316456 RepID=UPI0035A3B668